MPITAFDAESVQCKCNKAALDGHQDHCDLIIKSLYKHVNKSIDFDNAVPRASLTLLGCLGRGPVTSA